MQNYNYSLNKNAYFEKSGHIIIQIFNLPQKSQLNSLNLILKNNHKFYFRLLN